MHNRILPVAALAIASLMSASASAQMLPTKFHGTYVCERVPTTRGALRVPLDLTIEGRRVRFARPLLNLNGTRIVGTELARGTIDGNGQLHLTSAWSYLGNTAAGDYSGTLTPAGGSLTGTQTWRAPGNPDALHRICTAALVPAPGS